MANGEWRIGDAISAAHPPFTIQYSLFPEDPSPEAALLRRLLLRRWRIRGRWRRRADYAARDNRLVNRFTHGWMRVVRRRRGTIERGQRGRRAISAVDRAVINRLGAADEVLGVDLRLNRQVTLVVERRHGAAAVGRQLPAQ